jgi:uncharacterized protein
MKIAVYGATGNVGTRLVREAASRGHRVLALSRHPSTTEVPDGVTVASGDVTDYDEVRGIASSHDVVVAAFGPDRDPDGDPSAYVATLVGLAEAVGSTRLIVVGGAGSLFASPGVRLVDTPEFPEPYKAESLAGCAGLDALRETSADWTYLSPAPEFGPGERTGVFTLGLDDVIGDHVSFEDYAVALVDEIEQPAHRRQRFTVAN